MELACPQCHHLFVVGEGVIPGAPPGKRLVLTCGACGGKASVEDFVQERERLKLAEAVELARGEGRPSVRTGEKAKVTGKALPDAGASQRHRPATRDGKWEEGSGRLPPEGMWINANRGAAVILALAGIICIYIGYSRGQVFDAGVRDMLDRSTQHPTEDWGRWLKARGAENCRQIGQLVVGFRTNRELQTSLGRSLVNTTLWKVARGSTKFRVKRARKELTRSFTISGSVAIGLAILAIISSHRL